MPLSLLKTAHWHNEPRHWLLSEDCLIFHTTPKSDFWQQTYYGFTPDNGHFLGCDIEGDFCATLEFSGDYTVQYDQIGLMLRQDRTHWIKTGIEYSDNVPNFSTVVTRGLSDWSVIQRPDAQGRQAVRLTRKGEAILAHFREETGAWKLMRLANFEISEKLMIGPVACSPLREEGQDAFCATVHEFNIAPAPADPLHGMAD